ncbi:uncharacterized protein LOC129579698 [Sitodiplosis mosellana]|uniref:uncharacterized protein LOC129579698 n=1 Tax=Sitodiplosis mosellana TaxID=263140 RepID=UPI002443EB14|nr:uncharacterized protein LOC129579698 [Sitodiplosis mosellana]
MLWEKDDEVKKSKFEELNDDCCYEILRKLPLDDLCALSCTCVRLHNLCSKQFQKEYPSKVMRIEGTYFDGKLIKQPNEEKYISCFDKSIRNLVLLCSSANDLAAVSAFYRQNEEVSGVVKEIRFLHWREVIRRSRFQMKDAGEVLSDVLKSVETIIFDDVVVWTDDSWDENIFRHTPNLKRLTIRNGQLTTVRPIKWLQKPYPKLESLEWYGFEVPDAEELKSFLALNPNVQRISLSSMDEGDISKFIELDVKIDELFFSSLGDDASNLNTLKGLCDVQNVKLHLGIFSIRYQDTDLISQLESLQPHLVGLYMMYTIEEQVVSTMDTFEHLQCLRIKVTRLPKNYKALMAKMPNLREMFLDQITKECQFKTVRGMILAAVGQLTKLTKLYLRGSWKTLKKMDFAAVHQERTKLKGAKFLEIFIELLHHLDVFPLERTSRYFDCMAIYPTASEPPNNPFFFDIYKLLAAKNDSGGYEWERV